jgi:aryl-alcohol dehydrogenase-like predicted oxidoreductase
VATSIYIDVARATLVVYDDLVRQGKLRYVTLSNHPAWQVTQALSMGTGSLLSRLVRHYL